MPKRNRGQQLYAEREKYFAKRWREEGKQVPWKDYKRSAHFVKHKADWALQQEQNKRHKPNDIRSDSDAAGPSTSTPRDNAEGGSVFDNVPYIGDTPPDEYDFSDSDLDFLLHNLDGGNMANVPMDMDVPILGENRSASGGAGSRMAAGAGSAIVPFPKSTGGGHGLLHYRKSRVMYSYAYTNEKLEHNKEGTWKKTMNYYTTPLALVPVDWLPFYLTEAEFKILDPRYVIKSVWCKVKILGVRSSFDTGSTTANVATAEYCPILLTAVGLNNELNLHNYSYNAQATSPMKPSAIAEPNQESFIQKLYVEHSSTTMCVPRSLPWYAVWYHNKPTRPTPDNNEAYGNFEPWDSGMVHMDKYVQQYLLNSAIGEQVIDYKYHVKNGIIKPVLKSHTPWSLTNKSFKNPITSKHVENRLFYDVDNKRHWMNDFLQTNYVSNMDPRYNRSLEGPDAFTIKGGPFGAHQPQPQVHIGMAAIPQLNPSTENSNFLNAAVYYHIDCGITFEASQGYDSKYTKGEYPYVNPDEIVFMDEKETQMKYYQPENIMGRVPQQSSYFTLSEKLNDADFSERHPMFSKLLRKQVDKEADKEHTHDFEII